MNISVVVPLYNEEASLPELVEWIARVMHGNQYSFEIILVDDGSSDRSWNVIGTLAAAQPYIRGIRFRRNYGKSAALFCGFEAAQGEVVITMDADLQDSPDEIPALYEKITSGNFDMVSGWKKKRHDSKLAKNIPSKIFNAVARLITGIKLHDMNCGLKAYKNKVVKSVEVYGEMHRYIPVLAKQAGFTRIGEQVVVHHPRKYGQSKFGLSRFIHGFLDLMSVVIVGKFGKKPMHFFGVVGTLMFMVGGFIALWLIASKLLAQSSGEVFRAVTDQPLFYLAILAIIIGVQLFLTGFIAELVARSGGDRNKYLIDEKIGYSKLGIKN
ncbi:MAG: glycosyltransferase family 2 protein [Prevotellaceae bacterium]|jgi:glycosyltransferase involved in cell wall biosynthesis|nr:glycosyltransferase family 2 protein [Prevotellaceae bacterium]